jgi:hypothetical protein
LSRVERVNTLLTDMFLVAAASERLEEAEQALILARKHEPQRVVAELMGERGFSEPNVETAEWGVQEAREALKLAERTKEALLRERDSANEELASATNPITESPWERSVQA